MSSSGGTTQTRCKKRQESADAQASGSSKPIGRKKKKTAFNFNKKQPEDAAPFVEPGCEVEMDPEEIEPDWAAEAAEEDTHTTQVTSDEKTTARKRAQPVKSAKRKTRSNSRLHPTRKHSTPELYEATCAPTTRPSPTNSWVQQREQLKNQLKLVKSSRDLYKESYFHSLCNEHILNKKLLAKDIPVDRESSSAIEEPPPISARELKDFVKGTLKDYFSKCLQIIGTGTKW